MVEHVKTLIHHGYGQEKNSTLKQSKQVKGQSEIERGISKIVKDQTEIERGQSKLNKGQSEIERGRPFPGDKKKL